MSMTSPEAAKVMQSIGDAVERKLKPGTGFCVFVFCDNADGPRMEYVSNCERKDVLKSMHEALEILNEDN